MKTGMLLYVMSEFDTGMESAQKAYDNQSDDSIEDSDDLEEEEQECSLTDEELYQIEKLWRILVDLKVI